MAGNMILNYALSLKKYDPIDSVHSCLLSAIPVVEPPCVAMPSRSIGRFELYLIESRSSSEKCRLTRLIFWLFAGGAD